MNETTAISLEQATPLPDWATAPVVVVGGGPAGLRAAQELSRRGREVLLFNAEGWQPYNRVKLTPLLAGEVQVGQVTQPDDMPGPGRVTRYDGTRIVAIDRARKTVTAVTGRVFRYSSLVLALGSRPFIPAIPGKERSGVYAFRDARDAEALLARSFSARKVVVIGGGLLGLEAARGMAKRGAEVTVVEHEARLMPRQLDDAASQLLATRIAALGVQVRLGTRVREIAGADRVTGVALSSGEELACDTVIICTGVRANVDLAREAGLRVERGVRVDDALRTSDPNVYAVGECAQHRGTVYGLVGPGLEQAAAAAEAIAGGESAYEGSTPATKLKVIGAEVFSMGPVEILEERPEVRSIVYWDEASGIYRRIFVERGRLLAAVGLGDWPEASALQQAILRWAPVSFLEVRRFRRTGRLWQPEDPETAAEMPAQAIVCNCTGVTRGRIGAAIGQGAGSLEAVRRETSANTVCGSCAPLIEEILSAGAPVKPQPVPLWRPAIGLSVAAALLVLATVLVPRVPVPDTFADGQLLRRIWFDSVWKQWSGYTLLGLSVAAAVLSLRRRLGWLQRLWRYEAWRIAHIGLGLLTIVALLVHTGLRFGSNLNLMLMAAFVATAAFGVVAGLVIGGEHALRARGMGSVRRPPRRLPIWLHILVVWPLPVLLAVHIASVYAF